MTPDAIATLLSNPKPDSVSDIPEIIVQITNLEPKGKSYGYLLYLLFLSCYFVFYVFITCFCSCGYLGLF